MSILGGRQVATTPVEAQKMIQNRPDPILVRRAWTVGKNVHGTTTVDSGRRLGAIVGTGDGQQYWIVIALGCVTTSQCQILCEHDVLIHVAPIKRLATLCSLRYQMVKSLYCTCICNRMAGIGGVKRRTRSETALIYRVVRPRDMIPSDRRVLIGGSAYGIRTSVSQLALS